jgi:hypothetical protein
MPSPHLSSWDQVDSEIITAGVAEEAALVAAVVDFRAAALRGVGNEEIASVDRQKF